MRFGLLGPLTAVDDAGVALSLPGRQVRVLLAALLLHPNLPVSADVLAQEVWDAQPSPSVTETLCSYVRKLCRTLGPQGASRVEARDPGYLIRVEPAESDVLEFEALCWAAGSALREKAWANASAAAAQALQLWRGEPLVDVASQVLRDEFVPRLEQLRAQVLEDGIEADLHLGRHDRLVPQLRELTRIHPLRERFHNQLILALYRSGRQAEALQAYQVARRVLARELGIEPGPELQRVQERILAGDGGLLAPQPSASTASTATVAADAVPHQLPAAARYFTGRGTELDAILDCCRDATAVGGAVVVSAIDGMAGVGKTTLAVHAAHLATERFPDGQLFLDLHGYTKGHAPRGAREALGWLLNALGVPPGRIPEGTEARAALYRERLTDTRTLIVLDNASEESQVRPLLPGGPGCLVLVTSRRRLKGLDDARSLPLGLLPPRDAARLLRAVAGADRVSADDPLLGVVAQLCGRLPLALRIAGALLRHRPAWSLRHLADLLRDQHLRIRALSDGEHDLATVFDLSYTRLGDRHRLLLRRLGLTPGPDADAYAAAALLEVDPGTATGLLEDLVDHNLLIEHVPGRYRLHDLIRAHVRTLAVGLDPESERAAALDRLLHYYARTAQRASLAVTRYPRPALQAPVASCLPAHSPALAGMDAARNWLRTERADLEAAHTHALAHALDEHVVALAAGLAELLRMDGPWSRAVELQHAATEAAVRLGRPLARAAALNESARVLRLAGDLRAAGDALGRALSLYRENGDLGGEAATLIDLGRIRYLTTDIAGATEALDRALEIYRAVGDRHGQAAALNELGRVRHLAGDYSAVDDALTRALEIYREIGNPLGEATALHDLGRKRQATGELPGAVDALDRALCISREIGHRQFEASSLATLGITRHLAGSHEAAGDALLRALQIFRELGARGDEAWALNHYAAVLAATGERDRAVALYRRALAMNRELNKPDDEALSLEGIAEHALAARAPARAVAGLGQALEIYRRLGMHPDVERVRARLAEVGTEPARRAEPVSVSGGKRED